MDLVFIAAFLAAAGTLIVALAAALRGRGRQALMILRRFGIAAAVYLLVVLTVSWSTRPHMLHPGEPKCNGEWCIAVAGAKRPADGGTLTVVLKLFSTAKRVAMREDARVYLVDADGRRFEPRPDASAAPLNVRLEAGQSVTTQRVFDVPRDAASPALVVRFGGEGFPGCLVIGENTWLHEPDRMLLE